MKQLLFWVVLASVGLSSATATLSIVKPRFRVWPPPSKSSWQFYYNGVMSYTGLFGLLLIGVLDWNSFVFHGSVRFLVGGALASCGLFALWGFLALGVQASQGLGDALVTRGPYRYSRNPQYVGTIPATLGYALICNSTLALVVALAFSVSFVLVVFAEESWCREHLGAAYEEYAAKVPRFFGLR